MHTPNPRPIRSWYDTPYGRLCERTGHRRPQPSVAAVLAGLLDVAH